MRPFLGFLLGGIAAGFLLAGYLIYCRGLFRNEVQPNATSWSLWALGSTVTLLVYGAETADLGKLMLPITCALCSIVVTAYSLFKGKFRWPDRYDYVTIVADLSVLGLWLTLKRSEVSYFALLLDTALTFIPILRSTARNPSTESRQAWGVWSISYGLLIGVCLVEWEGFLPLLLPMTYLALHARVFVLAGRTTAHPAVPQ